MTSIATNHSAQRARTSAFHPTTTITSILHQTSLPTEFLAFFLKFCPIHVSRVPYNACIPLKYGEAIHQLNQQIEKSLPATKLLAANRPQLNLRKKWHKALVHTLN